MKEINKTRPIVYFNKTVSPREIVETVGHNFSGDIIVLGDIVDYEEYPLSTTIYTGGGEVCVYGSIHTRRILEIEGDVTFYGNIFANTIKVIGSMCCHPALGKGISANEIAVTDDFIAAGDNYFSAQITVGHDFVTTKTPMFIEVLGRVIFI